MKQQAIIQLNSETWAIKKTIRPSAFWRWLVAVAAISLIILAPVAVVGKHWHDAER
jgi:hypothetical protein